MIQNKHLNHRQLLCRYLLTPNRASIQLAPADWQRQLNKRWNILAGIPDAEALDTADLSTLPPALPMSTPAVEGPVQGEPDHEPTDDDDEEEESEEESSEEDDEEEAHEASLSAAAGKNSASTVTPPSSASTSQPVQSNAPTSASTSSSSTAFDMSTFSNRVRSELEIARLGRIDPAYLQNPQLNCVPIIDEHAEYINFVNRVYDPSK